MTDFDMNDALALIGRKEVELTVLREHIGILQAHRCEPCKLEHELEELPGEDEA